MKKKNKLFKILLMTVIIFNLTGCTKYLKNSDKQIVKNELTGQNLASNILCKPEAEETIKTYEKYDVNIEELPACSNLSLNNTKYDGIWTTVFVKPLAIIIIKIGELVKNYGLSVIIITLLIRLILYPITKKTAMQSESLKKAKPELDKLEIKYANKTTQDDMMKKSQEMMMIYKKHGINPMSGCLFGFLQIPLFLAFYEALYRLPVLFEDKFLIFNMSTAPISGMSAGKYFYIILPIVVGIVTYFSFKLNSGASMGQDQAKQMKMMTNIMMIVILFTSFSMSTAIILYWITNSTFTIVQNLLVKRSNKK